MDNIEISIFPFKFRYFDDLIELHKSNDYLQLDTIQMKTLPKVGYIAFLGDTAVAAGFLRRVEGGYAQLDTLVSNAHFGSQVRHIAIGKVVQSLLEEAKTLQLQGVIAFTSDLGVIRRAEAIGFHVLESYKLIAFRP